MQGLKLELLQLRMKIMYEHVSFKRMLLIQEGLTRHMLYTQQDLLLELIIQVSESLSVIR